MRTFLSNWHAELQLCVAPLDQSTETSNFHWFVRIFFSVSVFTFHKTKNPVILEIMASVILSLQQPKRSLSSSAVNGAKIKLCFTSHTKKVE